MRIIAPLLALLLEALLGCASMGSSRAAMCSAPTTKSFVDLPDLTGIYEVEFIATSGERRGKRVRGKLELKARDSVTSILYGLGGQPNSRVREPYFGYMTVDLASVGAFTEGSVASRDSQAPGVTVRSWSDRAEGQTEFRFGSDANRRDRFILDGAYVGTDLLEATSARFAGKWSASLGYTSYHAAGFFCGRRI